MIRWRPRFTTEVKQHVGSDLRRATKPVIYQHPRPGPVVGHVAEDAGGHRFGLKYRSGLLFVDAQLMEPTGVLGSGGSGGGGGVIVCV